MKSSAGKIQLAGFNDLFQTDDPNDGGEQVREVALSELHPFQGHPFQVRDDAAMQEITGYLSADLNLANDDFWEVLSSHLLTAQDKRDISDWMRAGEDNQRIAQRLSERCADRVETVTLESGDAADYFTSVDSMAVEIQNTFGTKLDLTWKSAARILRTMYQKELDGFSHDSVWQEKLEQAEPSEPEPAQAPTSEVPEPETVEIDGGKITAPPAPEPPIRTTAVGVYNAGAFDLWVFLFGRISAIILTTSER